MKPKRRPSQGWLVELNQKVKISREYIATNYSQNSFLKKGEADPPST
jgi:hypothetical protein